MPTATAVPLESLAQRIARQQAELEALRRQYEARQAHLADLKRRKQDLQDQLRQLDADIQAVDQGKSPAPTGTTKTIPIKATPASLPTNKVRPQTLSGLLTRLVAGSKEPLTVKQLTEEVVRRKFPTSSQNIPGLVQTRVRELVAKGFLQRAPDQPGFVLARPGSEA